MKTQVGFNAPPLRKSKSNQGPIRRTGSLSQLLNSPKYNASMNELMNRFVQSRFDARVNAIHGNTPQNNYNSRVLFAKIKSNANAQELRRFLNGRAKKYLTPNEYANLLGVWASKHSKTANLQSLKAYMQNKSIQGKARYIIQAAYVNRALESNNLRNIKNAIRIIGEHSEFAGKNNVKKLLIRQNNLMTRNRRRVPISK